MKEKNHIDYEVVDMIAEAGLQFRKERSMGFIKLFRSKIASHHLIPCRVCHTFHGSRPVFIDSDHQHDAVVLCQKHYMQFKSYYREALIKISNDDFKPANVRDFIDFHYAEDVVSAIIELTQDEIGFEVYEESNYPLVADMSRCDFFLDMGRRDVLIKKIRLRRAKMEDSQDINRIAEECCRVYGIDCLPFSGPWDRVSYRSIEK